MSDKPETAEERLRAQIDVIPWKPLWRQFAFGRVLVVRDGLDLVEVGLTMSRDDREQVEAWLESGALSKPGDAEAKAWDANQDIFEMVVVEPWVLIRRAETSA